MVKKPSTFWNCAFVTGVMMFTVGMGGTIAIAIFTVPWNKITKVILAMNPIVILLPMAIIGGIILYFASKHVA